MILSMLARSIISYSVFLTGRKIVNSSLGATEGIKKGLRLHRCKNCWRLYSGEIIKCTFCAENCYPLYEVYKKENYKPYDNPQEFEKREGLEKQVYNDSRELVFEPFQENKNDRNSRRTSPKSSRIN